MPLVTFDDRELMGEGDNASNFVWCKPSADLNAGWISNWTVITSRGSGFTVSGTDITCNKSGTVRVCVMIDNMNGSTQQDKSVVIYKNSTAISQGYEYGAYSTCITAQAMVDVVVGDVIKIATSTGTTKQQFSTLLCEYINEYYLISYANVNNSYSTNETATGGVWINGKPLYRKAFTYTAPNDANSVDVADLTNCHIDDLTHLFTSFKVAGSYTNTGTGVAGRTWIRFNYNNSGHDYLAVVMDNSSYYGSNAITVIEYTKTTD